MNSASNHSDNATVWLVCSFKAFFPLFMLDVKHVLRGLLWHPTFTLTSVLTLTLGVGAVVAIFSVVYSVLIRPLPYPDSGELVRVRHSASALGNEIFTSSTMYLTYRAQNRSFEEFGLWQETTQNLTGGGNPEQVQALLVTNGTLQALGIQPVTGRWFTAEEHEPGTTVAEPVILTHRFWQRRFGADESVVGLEFELDSSRVRVVGVMPPDFRFLDMVPQPDVIRAIRLDPARQVIGAFSYQSLGRLKSGITPAEASAEIERMLPIWLGEWPISAGSRLTKESIADWRIVPLVRPLFLLHGLALSGVGIVVGLVVAAAVGRSMSSLLFGIEPLDPVAAVAALGVMLAAAALASYLPARRGATIDPMESLRSE